MLYYSFTLLRYNICKYLVSWQKYKLDKVKYNAAQKYLSLQLKERLPYPALLD